MEISEKELRHLAQLSNISLSDDEITPLADDLAEILKYVAMLDKLDLTDVEPTFQVTNLKNVFREDEILPQISREELLNLAPAVKNNQVKVPKVL
jgi:aspartyl-tRNA(Asn)/glutamyl-tRNA(Gln) amidotransferase subunit C